MSPSRQATGAGSLGNRQDPYAAFNFLVEIEGLVIAGFSDVSGLQIETVLESYREGGLNEYEHKLAGPTRYPSNLVLKHGLTASDTLWSWHQDVTRGVIKRKNGSIYLLDQQQQTVLAWNFKGAYPVKWSGPDFKADSNNVAVETVELVHQGISRASTAPRQN